MAFPIHPSDHDALRSFCQPRKSLQELSLVFAMMIVESRRFKFSWKRDGDEHGVSILVDEIRVGVSNAGTANKHAELGRRAMPRSWKRET
jgi:hypothetical protein